MTKNKKKRLEAEQMAKLEFLKHKNTVHNDLLR